MRNNLKKLLNLILFIATITAVISLVSCGGVSESESTDLETSTTPDQSGHESESESVSLPSGEVTTADTESGSALPLREPKAIWTDNYTVSVAGMEYFYRNVANSYIQRLESYGLSSYVTIDHTKSHKDQLCTMASDGSTWFDFFLAYTKSEVSKLLSCAEAAKAEGIVLDDEDYALIDESITKLKGYASSCGYTLKQYLKAVYGSSVTESVVRDCLELQTMYGKYVTAHVDKADISDEALEKFYNDNKDAYDKDGVRDESLGTADVRHILFYKDDYKDDTKALEILKELKKVVGTDEFVAKFEKFAKEYSYDTANKDKGGLMEGLCKGTTVEEFDTWVFGGEHKEGDLGIVETKDYGWHIVYFEKEGLPVWKDSIINVVKADAQTEAEKTAADTYTVTCDDDRMSKDIDA